MPNRTLPHGSKPRKVVDAIAKIARAAAELARLYPDLDVLIDLGRVSDEEAVAFGKGTTRVVPSAFEGAGFECDQAVDYITDNVTLHCETEPRPVAAVEKAA